ncbi:MAG: sugar transferase [Alkalibacterium sp.]|nr:sugar transferase [Alkalibacterium sp.]
MEQKNFYDEYLISIEENMQRNYTYIQFYPVIIRLIDIFMAVLGIIITFPIVFVFSIAIKIETPGPIFYLQERVGYNGVYFKVIKLRSMGIDAEKNGAQWADKNDPRCHTNRWFYT